MTQDTSDADRPDGHPFFTIGHSARSADEFLALMKGAGIEVVVDVRTMPGSRTNPQFNAEPLARTLAGSGLRYKHYPALGGLRKRSHEVPPQLNGFWRNQSFHNYADYALGDEFQAALQDVRALGRQSVCAIMCAEAVWWRCHRRIIADYLIAANERVFHTLNAQRTEPAQLTRGAEIRTDGRVIYPAGD